jgi:hypothetical protein
MLHQAGINTFLMCGLCFGLIVCVRKVSFRQDGCETYCIKRAVIPFLCVASALVKASAYTKLVLCRMGAGIVAPSRHLVPFLCAAST